LLQAQRKQAALRLPDSIATAAWPASAASVSRVGYRAAVADLGQQLRGADHALGCLEQRQEDGAVGVFADGGRDLAL
jgi:hypothetical protein